MLRFSSLRAICLAGALFNLACSTAQGLDRIAITLPPEITSKPITGRAFIFFSSSSNGEPRMGPNWFNPEPFFGQDVTLQPGATCQIDGTADSFPKPLDTLTTGKYRVQAVLHHAFDCPFPGSGAGNFYSEVQEIDLAEAKELQLTLTKVVERPEPPQRPWLKTLNVTSKRLSDFHKREVIERATVILPADYDEQTEARYPVLFSIPGFGGSERDVWRLSEPPPVGDSGVAFIRVYLSGQTQWGHHVFADSRTNGPCGAALVHELIPELDRQFRTIAEPRARFLTGHSSGGWSSLWLQVSYPETFGGVWSTAPDPVDFRDYQGANLYAASPENMFTTRKNERRPIARRGLSPVVWYDDFTRMDDVLKRGGQLRSFEAVFSALDEQGQPRLMYDRKTGQIDPAVVETWKPYDIRLKLEQNWATLGPQLKGKLHVFMGDQDTFYLEGAVRELKQTLEQLGSDAVVEMVAGADHGSLLTPDLRQRIRREMAEQFRKFEPAAVGNRGN